MRRLEMPDLSNELIIAEARGIIKGQIKVATAMLKEGTQPKKLARLTGLPLGFLEKINVFTPFDIAYDIYMIEVFAIAIDSLKKGVGIADIAAKTGLSKALLAKFAKSQDISFEGDLFKLYKDLAWVPAEAEDEPEEKAVEAVVEETVAPVAEEVLAPVAEAESVASEEAAAASEEEATEETASLDGSTSEEA
jgi:hypothetical protein